MALKTPLFENHLASNAKLVDFAGWDMPIHYGSQLEEHHQVRKDAGIFDVSHMTVLDITGPQAFDFLRVLLANDIAKLKLPGKALYSCMLNENAGVVDDLIAYRLGDNDYRLVVNAGTREKDIAWIQKHAQRFDVEIKTRFDLAILAIQGPNALNKAIKVFDSNISQQIQSLKPFEVFRINEYCIARTGYTGEDGIEVMLPADDAPKIWNQALSVTVKPVGLGARDTLRLEAGLNLYGSDMDENTSPLESNLAWTIAWDPEDRAFIGREALQQKKISNTMQLVGLVLEQKGVLRNHQKVIVPGEGEGEITSGSFSPTLQQAIALARIPKTNQRHCFVEIRGQQIPARIIKPPFVRHGKKTFEL